MADEKPVRVTLESDDGQTVNEVHHCDTILEAEEWIAEQGAIGEIERQNVEAGRYSIDAPEGMMEAYAMGANQVTDTAEVDAAPALNHLGNLHALLTSLVVAVQELGEDATLPENVQTALDTANEALDSTWASPDDYASMPELREFDEIVSQGREQLIDWIDGGRQELFITDKVRVMDDGRDDLRIPVPLHAVDALGFMRRRIKEVIGAVGFGPASYAIPGLADIIWRLDFISKVPVPEQYADNPRAFAALSNAAYTSDQFKEATTGDRIVTMKRSDLQLGA